MLSVVLSGCKKAQTEASNNGPDGVTEEAETDVENYLDSSFSNAMGENSDEYFETFNPWQVHNFVNEWGEETEHKFLSTVIQASGWDINIQYKPSETQLPQGAFRFSIIEDEDTDYYPTVESLAKAVEEITGSRHLTTFDACKKALAYYASRHHDLCYTIEEFKVIED